MKAASSTRNWNFFVRFAVDKTINYGFLSAWNSVVASSICLTYPPSFSLPPGPGDRLLLSAWDGGLVQPAGASAEVSVKIALLPVLT